MFYLHKPFTNFYDEWMIPYQLVEVASIFSSLDETSPKFVLRFTDFGDVIMTKYLENIFNETAVYTVVFNELS